MKMTLKYKLFFIPLIFVLMAQAPAPAINEVNPTEDAAKKKINPPSEVTKILPEKNNQINSLMFDDQELNSIDRAREAYESGSSFTTNDDASTKETKIEDNVKSFIYLSSILYFSPDNWSVWINDKKISSANNKPGAELYVKSINGDEANILWTISSSKWKALVGKKSEEFTPIINKNNQIEVPFRLKSNQTFMLLSNKVVEGKVSK